MSADPMRDSLYSAAEFRRRSLRQVGETTDMPWRGHSDILMNPSYVDALKDLKLRDAAVLIPVVDEGPDARVILTQRTSKMRKHSGQVAFPGGGIDPEDASPEAAAIREAGEEIGLLPEFIETVARLPVYEAMSGFAITPVLAVVKPGFKLKMNEDEVDAVFDVPLSFLMNEKNHILDSREWAGTERFYYRMPYGEWNIWGVTAGILHTAWERLYAW